MSKRKTGEKAVLANPLQGRAKEALQTVGIH